MSVILSGWLTYRLVIIAPIIWNLWCCSSITWSSWLQQVSPVLSCWQSGDGLVIISSVRLLMQFKDYLIRPYIDRWVWLWVADRQAGDHCPCHFKCVMQFRPYLNKLSTTGESGFALLTVWWHTCYTGVRHMMWFKWLPDLAIHWQASMTPKLRTIWRRSHCTGVRPVM